MKINQIQHSQKTKKLSILFTALILSFTTVGCQTADQSKPTPEPQVSPIAANQRFPGVKLRVLTFDGPQIAEPLKRRAPEFQALTGANVEVITVPFGQLYDEIKQDFQRQTKKYDVVVFHAQWMVDYAAPGYLENLTDRVAKDSAIAWDDIAPFFRNFSSTYQGRIYTIPLDGDFQMVYYRSDLLEKAGLQPPATWEDYITIAQKFQGQDLNGDGTPDYGSCIAKQPNTNTYWMIWSVASPYLQSQGTQHGSFFDPETMKPLVKNQAFAKALNIFKETTKYAPPNEINLDLSDVRKLFLSGRCALTLDWGDMGTLAIDRTRSQVIDRVGAVILPGSREVLDRTTGKLVTCDKFTCPYNINGINYAPYAATGGWTGAVNAGVDLPAKNAAYAFLSYMSQPAQSNIDVTIGASGFNPYRISQFTNLEQWLKAGMSFEAASKYLGAIGVSLRNPNVVLDLGIPLTNQYQEKVLDQVVADFLQGKTTTDQAMQQLYDRWEDITNKTGREAQKAAYRASLGLTK
jgi:multiple sugar transport system substrate-binding protein